VIQRGTAKSAGLFAGSDRTSVLHLDRPVPRGSVVAVTLERAGGVDQPTQQPLAATSEVS
jgi:anti-sigma-K factor RskA